MHEDATGSSLFGRDVELGALRDSVARASCADGHVFVAVGEAGIGKTALAAQAAREAGGSGFTVLSCGGDSVGSRPFGPLRSALTPEAHLDDSSARAVDSLLQDRRASASLFSAATPERRHAAADAFAQMIADCAARRPTMLVVEDLHWVDSSTLLALHAAGRRAAGHTLLLLLTTRPPATEEAEREVRRLTGANGARVHLGALSTDAVAELVAERTGLPPGPALRRLLRGAGGNPFFAGELINSLIHDGLLHEVDGTVEASENALPPSFADRVLETVGELDHDARGVLRLGAMLGASFSLADLADASGRSAVALAEPVQSALRAGLLGERGEQVVFRHELVRAAIYDALPQTVRAGVHRHIAMTLADSAAPAVTVAEHYARGAQPGDTEAIGWLQRGAAEVAASAPDTALALLDRASELAEPSSPLRPALDVGRVEALGLCGRLAAAEELSARVLHTLDDPQARAHVRQRRAAVLLLLNRGAEAGAELQALAAGLQPPESVRALAEAAICFLAAADVERARAAAAQALDASAGSGVGHSLALGILSRDASTRLEFDSSLGLAEEGLAAADRDDGPDGHMYQPLWFVGLSLHDLDRFDEVLARVETGRAISLAHGWSVSGGPYCALAAFTHLRAGRLAEAAREAKDGVELGERLGSRLAIPWCHAVVGLTALHHDDIALATTAVHAAEELIAEAPLMLGLDLVVLARALLDEASAQEETAATGLYDAWAAFRQLGLENLAGAIAPDLVRLSAAAGRTVQAEEVTATLAEAAERLGLPSWQAAAAQARGRLTGDVTQALHAVELYRATPRLLGLARAQEDAGNALCDNGDRERGRRMLRDAAEAFDACGATRDKRRVVVALRAAGGRPRTSRTSPAATGWASLSRAEHQVADLVAGGLANAEVAARLFISRRTVETHLYRIYGKLGVRSRVELAVLATTKPSE